jgi:hypothetical protein
MTPDSIFEACHIPVNAYFMARAYAETMRERVDEVQRAVLAECPLDMDAHVGDFRRGDGKITDPSLTYLATDEHFRDYLEKCNKRERAIGIKPADMPDDNCPALVAEHLQYQAEWLLLECGWCAIDVDGHPDGWKWLYGEKRKRFIDLLCGLVLDHPKYERPNV